MENLLLNIFILQILFFSGSVDSLGINYGQVGNNLPAPEEVLRLLRSLKVSKARIYDTNPQILNAFANSDVEITVTVENDLLSTLIDPNQSLQWVKTNIGPYFPAARITGIAVGNEVFSGGGTELMNYLVPAMISIQGALVQLGLDQFIHVSTPNSLAVLEESYPPSAGCFRPELAGIMPELLKFLVSTKSTFWINSYPYFAYKDNPHQISLDYVLFNPNTGAVDPNTKLRYDNMLYAQVDAVTFAMAKMGFTGVEVGVSETGWPSRGDQNEIGATLENAAVYNRNLMTRQSANEGTPLKPDMKLDVYVFALFNEDMKPGPTSERNYGLFRPDGTMAYNVGISSPLPTATITLTSDSNEVKGIAHWRRRSFVLSILLQLVIATQRKL